MSVMDNRFNYYEPSNAQNGAVVTAFSAQIAILLLSCLAVSTREPAELAFYIGGSLAYCR